VTTTSFVAELLIDGKGRPASEGGTFPNINPYTEEEIGPTPEATVADVDAAVDAARRAFDETKWAEDHQFRGRCITQLREALQRHADELREILVSEVGCPVFMTRSPMIQLDVPLIYLEDAADLARSYAFETYMADLPRPAQTDRRLVIREPWGVVGIITPYNYPIQQLCAKVGPALAAGNTAVLKPSPFTPWTACAVGKIAAEETEIPPGVLNVLTTTRAEVSEAMVAHPGVDMISFTGSTAVGRRIMETAARGVKKLFLELGGKSASIVLDDADIENVVTQGVFRMSRHSGQGCTNLTRMLLPRDHYEAALEVAAAACAQVPWGDPWDETTHLGPQVGKPQQQRVLGYIEKGLAEGGRLVAGGGVPAGTTGYFVEATVIADVKPDDTIAQEEIFGPVLAVIPYESEEEAIAIANNSIYGLSGAVWSSSTERALRVARRVRTGTMDLNGASWWATDTPFGGMKQSGLGRENGVTGFEEYLDTRVISHPA
jgi:aldehyde dehydrogenase (NAD+)